MSKEEAFEKAYEIELGTEEHIVNHKGFQVDNIAEVEDEHDYNYRLGEEV